MKIGIFDSGKGGQFVCERLKVILPEHSYLVVDDHTHVPYGNRSGSEIVLLTDRALQPLIGKCDIIVLACNTATSVAIVSLRNKYPAQQFVGYEPMLKPAALFSNSKHITVLATRATRRSRRYIELRDEYANTIVIDTPDTDVWASHIENGRTDDISLAEVQKSVDGGSDIIVLACTHYLVLQERLSRQFPTTLVIEPTDAVAKRISAIAAELQP